MKFIYNNEKRKAEKQFLKTEIWSFLSFAYTHFLSLLWKCVMSFFLSFSSFSLLFPWSFIPFLHHDQIKISNHVDLDLLIV